MLFMHGYSFVFIVRWNDVIVSAPSFSDADVAKSILISLSNDIGQIACLNAKLHNLEKIYFGGYFIRGHPMTMHTISFAVKYWSKGDVQAMFLRHEGYLGAMGAFLKGVLEEGLYTESYSHPSFLLLFYTVSFYENITPVRKF